MRAVRISLPPGLRAEAAVDARLDMDDLRGGLHLRAGHDALAEAREHLAGPDLDEPLRSGVAERGERLPPADGADERLGELLADVLERPGGRAREHGEARHAE